MAETHRLMEGTARPAIRGAVIAGLAAVGVFFAGFGGWAAVAPLESAVVAYGVLGVESSRKTIQHLEGGILREILVRNGDRVEAGQVLIRLDDTQSGANLDLLRTRRDVALAIQARLEAERDGAEVPVFPQSLTARQDEPEVVELIAAQTGIFRTRRQALDGQVAILGQQVAQLRAEIVGLEGEIAAADRQVALLDEEIGDVESLFEKGLVPKARLLELKRRAAEIEGQRSSNRAAIARAQQSIGEAELRSAELRTAAVNEAVAELAKVQATLFDLSERLRAAEHVHGRTEVRAPHGGTVVNLRVHTLGGVVAPGEALLDIVPDRDRLVVEARIDPADADAAHAGLEAQVRLTSFSQRRVQPLRGRVMQVSADRLIDERTGQAYYSAEVELLDDPADVLGDAVVSPGMPAEVIIVTGPRSTFDYLLEPIAGVVRRALREP